MLLSRTISLSVGLRMLVLPRLMLALTAATALWSVASLAITAPASAMVSKVPTGVGSEEVAVGLQPRSTLLLESPIAGHPLDPYEFANSSGNPVVAANKTYAIYWDPTDHYHGDWQHVIDTFFQSMGAASGSFDSAFTVDTQYTDKANQHALFKSTFQGAYTDTNPYPTSDCEDPNPLEPVDLIGPEDKGEHTPVCLTDKQIQVELELFIGQHSLPKGMGTVFYLLTPPGVAVCLDGGGINGHCSDFAGSVSEMEADEDARKMAEESKKTYPESANYKSYKDSFCSYHSDISPTNPTSGDDNTILYGVIPWTAGGLGDYDLTIGDEKTPAYDCQDGGYDSSSKPVEEHEKKKEKTIQEVAEIEKMTAAEKEKVKEAEEHEGPHQQEPNQVKCPSPDGGCDTGLADLIINQIAVEQQNIVTDPLLNAWQDPYGNEATDECRDWYAPIVGGNVTAQEKTWAGALYNQTYDGNSYYLNDAFNLAALKLSYPGVGCISGIHLEPQFTVPNTVNANELVGFDGMESDITLNAGTIYTYYGHPQPYYATYSWNFGDDSPVVTGQAPGAPSVNSPGVTPCAQPWEAPCAASVYHSYQYGGTYNVTLTVTDAGGNTASITEPITVDGPPAPSPEPTPTPTPSSTTSGGSSGSGSSGSGGGSSQGQTGTTSSVPAPVVTASIASTSLEKVKTSGIAVHYTVNEQVAGSVQVLIESSVAKRLGIKGPAATGLAKGTPSEIVIGTAVIVTTKAGTGTVHIKFASKTAARLARSHKLKLMLRLVARNASHTHPLTTTTLSTVVLSG